MTKIRKQYNDQFKFKVTLEAIKGLATINEIASRFQVHPNQVRNWKKQLTDNGPMVFDQEYTRTPFYGSRKITVRLNQQLFEKVNRKCRDSIRYAS